MAIKVNEDELIGDLVGWKAVPGKNAIEKTYAFRTFSETWAFMTRAALKAEEMDHHPTFNNLYNRVKITLATHRMRAVTKLDYTFADFLDAIYEPMGGVAADEQGESGAENAA